MTAATVHTHHALDHRAHPMRDGVGDVLAWTLGLPWRLVRGAGRLAWAVLRWVGRRLRRLPSWVADFVDAHWEAVVTALVTAVSLSLVTGVAVWLTVSDPRFWQLGVAIFGGGALIVAIGHWAGGRK